MSNLQKGKKTRKRDSAQRSRKCVESTFPFQWCSHDGPELTVVACSQKQTGAHGLAPKKIKHACSHCEKKKAMCRFGKGALIAFVASTYLVTLSQAGYFS